MINVIKNIEEIRKEKGLKQEVIAEALGISQSAYSNYITRNRDLYFDRLVMIAKVLRVEVIDIITYPKKFIDPELIIDNSLSPDNKVIIQIELDESKRDQVMKLIFGEQKK